MSTRRPDNLDLLYNTFGEAGIDNILPGTTFEIDGVEFVCKYSPESTAERFFIVKMPELFEEYLGLSERFAGGNIFELGIAEGGSTALLALAARPRKLVAVDLEPEPLDALAEFVARRGLQESIRPYYAVDQSDRARLAEIVRDEFGGEPVDLVIDDASHALGPTRSSFESLFPHLRPGGTYLIEDWNSAHIFRDAMRAALRDPLAPDHEQTMQKMRESMAAKSKEPAPVVPELSQLAVECVLARASGTGEIAEVTVGDWWLSVRRGPGELDAETFRLADTYTDYFGYLPFPNRS